MGQPLAAGVAEPTLIGRVIAAWLPFAWTASYKLLTRQVRRDVAQANSYYRQPSGDGMAQPQLAVMHARRASKGYKVT